MICLGKTCMGRSTDKYSKGVILMNESNIEGWGGLITNEGWGGDISSECWGGTRHSGSWIGGGSVAIGDGGSKN